ncbi:MAG: cellulase family glycosylhydrolase [Anaerolineae bacterium]
MLGPRCSRSCLLIGLGLLLLSACAVATPEAAALLPTPSPTVTATPSPAPTSTAPPTPTVTPTPVPTVSLGFLTAPTSTVTATVTPLLPPPTPDPSDSGLHFSRAIPAPFGVNIHFTQAEPGELALLEAGGFRFVRMDLFWHKIEHEVKGRYDFSAYDVLVEDMARHGIRIIFILDYGNDLYGGGNAHHLEEGRAAFARFAAAAARHYRGRGIIWEIWNEPNLEKFWHAPPDPLNYADLTLKVIAAIRREDPTAWIVGPATAGFPWEYLEALAEVGLFNKLDAVTVHPYRHEAPETVWEDYVRLRSILDRVSPERKIPIIAGEWGYSTVEGGFTEQQQAEYVVRQWLSHLAKDVDLSIWYDWRNDGPNPHDLEHNFGLVRLDLEPKPSYTAARVLNETLKGYAFQRRIPLARPDDYVLLFRRGERVALAAWTSGEPHTITLPSFCDEVTVVEMLGEQQRLPVPGDEMQLDVTSAPRYVHLCRDERVTRLGLWRPVGSIHVVHSEGTERVLVEVENPYHATLQGTLHVNAGGETLGEAYVHAAPDDVTLVSVPVHLEDSGVSLLPAVVTFQTPDELPFQSAAIWLHRP